VLALLIAIGAFLAGPSSAEIDLGPDLTDRVDGRLDRGEAGSAVADAGNHATGTTHGLTSASLTAVTTAGFHGEDRHQPPPTKALLADRRRATGAAHVSPAD
jgi:hypothetical protein